MADAITHFDLVHLSSFWVKCVLMKQHIHNWEATLLAGAMGGAGLITFREHGVYIPTASTM